MQLPYYFLSDAEGNRYLCSARTSVQDYVNMNGNFIVERDTVADLIFFCANRAVYAMPLDITYANGIHMIVSNVHNGPTGYFDLEIIENGETTYQKTIGPNLYINTYYDGGPGNGLGFHRIERSVDYRFHTPEGDYLLSGSNPYIIALDNLILFSGVNNIGINVALSDYLPEIMNQSGYCAVYDITSVPGKGFKLKTYFINRSYPYRGSGYNERILYFMDYISYSTASGSSKSGDNFIRNTGGFPAREFSDSYNILQNVSGNGTLQLPSFALPGDTVTLTATPSAAYLLASLSITSGGETIPYTAIGSGVYTFVMPDSAVTVSATFQRIPLQAIADHGSFFKGFAVGQALRVNPRGVSGNTTIPARPDSSAQYDRDSFLLGLTFGRTFAGKIL